MKASENPEDENFRVEPDPVIKKRIHNSRQFAEILLWLNAYLKKNLIVYASDLCRVFRVSSSRASTILHEIEILELLDREEISKNQVCYKLALNDGHARIEKYIALANNRRKV